MEFKSKYNCGDKVFCIQLENVRNTGVCTKCNGQWRVKLHNGEYLECFTCHGGKIVIGESSKWFIRGVVTIGLVRIEYTDLDSVKEQYMCVETGVGTGTVHDVKNLLSADSDALKEIEIRNEKLRSEE